MVSVSDCSTRDQRGAFGLRQRGQRRAEEEREDGDLKDLVLRDGLGNVLGKDVEQDMLPACGWATGAADFAAGQRDADAGLGEVDGDGAEEKAAVVTTSKKTMALRRRGLRPELVWPATPVTMPPKMSGATIMRMRRRKISARKWVCAAIRGASTPSSAPMSMARRVQRASERRRIAKGSKSAKAAQRSEMASSARAWRRAAVRPAAKSSAASERQAHGARGLVDRMGFVGSRLPLCYGEPHVGMFKKGGGDWGLR